MKKQVIILSLFCGMFSLVARSQTTDLVLLNKREVRRLRIQMAQNSQVKHHYDSIAGMANQHLKEQPQPLKEILYEGLLETNPSRIHTRKSLEDIDKIINLIYAYYGSDQPGYAQQAKEIVTAWAGTYQPTGNPINENKLIPLFWAYYLFRDKFSEPEKKNVEAWMNSIAQGQMTRTRTPNNNWEAKRLKIIAIVGCIRGDKDLKDFAITGFKSYINTAYYADGTSNDLIERDALHYHIGGLKPTIGAFVNCTSFDPAFDLYAYTAPGRASIKKSVQYTLPYAQGKIKRPEWTNTKVALDKKRAAAGLAEYQPGKLFDPKEARPLFEWASYYHPEWYTLFGSGTVASNYAATWIGLLNSPLIRK